MEIDFSLRLIFLILFWLYMGVITLIILLDNKPPEVLAAWILLLVFLPYVGAVIYLYAGIDWRKRKIMKNLPEKVFSKYLDTIVPEDSKSGLTEMENDIVKTVNLLHRAGNARYTVRNSGKLYFTGSEHFDDLLKDLKNSQKSIHMEYFIWRSDKLGHQIKDILLERAAAGVKVRIILDGIGIFGRLNKKYIREMREGGIEVQFFLDPLNFFRTHLINYRNHRKIVVIDGCIGYTGGMNIGSEYIDGGKEFDSWRDTHLRLIGDSVSMLQTIFMADWANSRGKNLDAQDSYSGSIHTNNTLPMQIVTSGPDSDWHVLKKLFFNLISNANHRIRIQSPYFIPDQSIMAALEATALSGVNVELMITGRPDKRIPWWVAQTYFESLLKAGVTVYLYQTGFLHAKTITIDDSIATVGTCNMDLRSFHLDWEINGVFYNRQFTEQLSHQFEKDIACCSRLSIEEIRHLSMFKKIRNSILRLLAPLL